MGQPTEARAMIERTPKTTPEQERVLDAYRRWGYLAAQLDPLGFMQPDMHPELEPAGEAAERARRIYCGTIGAEFVHIPDPARRRWLAEWLEG